MHPCRTRWPELNRHTKNRLNMSMLEVVSETLTHINAGHGGKGFVALGRDEARIKPDIRRISQVRAVEGK